MPMGAMGGHLADLAPPSAFASVHPLEGAWHDAAAAHPEGTLYDAWAEGAAQQQMGTPSPAIEEAHARVVAAFHLFLQASTSQQKQCPPAQLNAADCRRKAVGVSSARPPITTCLLQARRSRGGSRPGRRPAAQSVVPDRLFN